MRFRVRGLAPEPFEPLFGLSESALTAYGAKRYTADAKPGFPDRIALRDAEEGESVLLVNYLHQPFGPYASKHAIFVSESGGAPYDEIGPIPEMLSTRPISLRAFDADHMMVDADLASGEALEGLIRRFLAAPRVAYLHAHFAKRGCYAARIERAEAPNPPSHPHPMARVAPRGAWFP